MTIVSFRLVNKSVRVGWSMPTWKGKYPHTSYRLYTVGRYVVFYAECQGHRKDNVRVVHYPFYAICIRYRRKRNTLQRRIQYVANTLQREYITARLRYRANTLHVEYITGLTAKLTFVLEDTTCIFQRHYTYDNWNLMEVYEAPLSRTLVSVNDKQGTGQRETRDSGWSTNLEPSIYTRDSEGVLVKWLDGNRKS